MTSSYRRDHLTNVANDEFEILAQPARSNIVAAITAFEALYPLPIAGGETRALERAFARYLIDSGKASLNGLLPGQTVVPPVPTNVDLPVITGVPVQGQTLTVSDGTWASLPTTYARQWKRNGANILGATGATYLLGALDVGAAISCSVTATNEGGSASATATAVNVTVAVSYADDLVNFASAERVNFSSQLRAYNEDADTSFARMANVAPLSATTGTLFWSQRNAFINDGEQALRLVAGDLSANAGAGTASLGTTRVIAQDADWNVGSPPGGVEGRGKEFHPVTLKIAAGHGSNVGNTVLLWNHLVSADGRDDLISNELQIFHAISTDNFATVTPVLQFTSADVYAHTGLTPPAILSTGATFAPGNNIIQLPSTSATPGRLVAVAAVIADNNWAPLLIYTDDIADGWTLGGFFQPSGTAVHNEASIAYDPTTDDILVLTRLEESIGGGGADVLVHLGRGVFRSSDGGATLEYEGINTDLAFSNCATGFLQTVSGSTAASRLLVASTTSPYLSRRDEFGIYICYDGVTPAAIYRPFPDKFNIGYNQLVKVDADTVWLIHETFSGVGAINTRDNLCITVLSLAEIILGAEAL